MLAASRCLCVDCKKEIASHHELPLTITLWILLLFFYLLKNRQNTKNKKTAELLAKFSFESIKCELKREKKYSRQEYYL